MTAQAAPQPSTFQPSTHNPQPAILNLTLTIRPRPPHPHPRPLPRLHTHSHPHLRTHLTCAVLLYRLLQAASGDVVLDLCLANQLPLPPKPPPLQPHAEFASEADTQPAATNPAVSQPALPPVNAALEPAASMGYVLNPTAAERLRSIEHSLTKLQHQRASDSWPRHQCWPRSWPTLRARRAEQIDG